MGSTLKCVGCMRGNPKHTQIPAPTLGRIEHYIQKHISNRHVGSMREPLGVGLLARCVHICKSNTYQWPPSTHLCSCLSDPKFSSLFPLSQTCQKQPFT